MRSQTGIESPAIAPSTRCKKEGAIAFVDCWHLKAIAPSSPTYATVTNFQFKPIIKVWRVSAPLYAIAPRSREIAIQNHKGVELSSKSVFLK